MIIFFFLTILSAKAGKHGQEETKRKRGTGRGDGAVGEDMEEGQPGASNVRNNYNDDDSGYDQLEKLERSNI